MRRDLRPPYPDRRSACGGDGGAGACWLVDRIVYAPPFGALGRWLGGRFVGERLERMFAYRHEVTRAAFAGWRAARWIVAAGVL